MTPKTPLPVDYATPGIAPKKRFARGLVGWALLIGLALLFLVLMRRSPSQYKTVTLTQFYSDISTANVRNVYLSENEVNYVTLKSGPAGFAGAYRALLPQGMGHDWNFVQFVMDGQHGGAGQVEVIDDNNLVINLLLPLIPWLLIFFFIWFFVFRQQRKNANLPKTPSPVYIVNPEAMQ